MDSGTWDYQQHLKEHSNDPNHGPEHLTETDHSNLPYSRTFLPNSRRLRLGEIERMTLEIEDSDAWDLESAAVELNGFIEESTSVSHGGSGVSGDEQIEIWRR